MRASLGIKSERFFTFRLDSTCHTSLNGCIECSCASLWHCSLRRLTGHDSFFPCIFHHNRVIPLLYIVAFQLKPLVFDRIRRICVIGVTRTQRYSRASRRRRRKSLIALGKKYRSCRNEPASSRRFCCFSIVPSFADIARF